MAVSIIRDKYKWNMLEAIGGQVTDISDGFARGNLPLSEQVMQPTGVFHAGAITVLADEVASAAIHGTYASDTKAQDKLFPYSVQISLNLLTNDPHGPLTAESKVVRRGRMTVVDTVVTSSSGETAALMRSTHMMVDLNKKGPHKTK
jgi:uncharacterized protein (TIGR00369 family)